MLLLSIQWHPKMKVMLEYTSYRCLGVLSYEIIMEVCKFFLNVQIQILGDDAPSVESTLKETSSFGDKQISESNNDADQKEDSSIKEECMDESQDITSSEGNTIHPTH